MSDGPHLPFSEILKSIPGTFGIRLEEEPEYQVVERLQDDVEVRRYAPIVVAEITIQGTHDAALDEAFDHLAKYIFGENVRRESMAMTTPVYQREGETMPMTTPVTQTPDGNGWTIAFFLANAKTAADAPQPTDPAIKLRTVPERLIAALRYTGNNTESRRSDSRATLLAAVQASGYTVRSDVSWAQYDAPFVIPFLKRNEAMIELDAVAADRDRAAR